MSRATDSARMLDILIPDGGILVAISEAYFDESYNDNSPRIICVAGYVFRKSRAIEFGKIWSRYLRSKALPYFHANECAQSRGIFAGRSDTDEVSRKLISLTREFSEIGVAVAVDRDEYLSVCSGHEMFATPYTHVLTSCLYQIAHWRDEKGLKSQTAFYFEQGHQHADDASKYLTFMMRGGELTRRIGYRSHAFVGKQTPQVHSGDLLSWLWRLHTCRQSAGSLRPTRKDLVALWRPQDRFTILNRAQLERFRDSVVADSNAVDAYVNRMARLSPLNEADIARVIAWKPNYKRAQP